MGRKIRCGPVTPRHKFVGVGVGVAPERSALWLDAAIVLTIGMSALNRMVASPGLPTCLRFLCLSFLSTSIKLFTYHLQQERERIRSYP